MHAILFIYIKKKHLIWYISTGQTHKGLSRERPTQQKMVGDIEGKSPLISFTIISFVLLVFAFDINIKV